MKRNTRITISISGIIIVSLMLLGLTYGYFITRIEGNTNSRSVTVSSGTMQLVYTDLSEETEEIIMPGFETIKVFTIENTGNVTAKYSIYLVDVINTFNRTKDITYTLYRTDGIVTDTLTTDTDYSSWTNVTSGNYPKTSTAIKTDEALVSKQESDDTNPIYTYVLKVVYENANENQNEDQGKTFSGKINIRGASNDSNPFSEGTLAYNIIENSKKELNGTKLVDEPLTKVGEEKNLGIYRDLLSNEELFAESDIAITYTDKKFIFKFLDDFEMVDLCSDPTYEAKNSTECGGMRAGISTCEEIKGKYIYNDHFIWPWYVEECMDYGVQVSSGVAGLDIEDSEYYNDAIDEKILATTQDDDGISFYYRGVIEDNYVNFAKMCWRIVRIDGLGNIKLILEDQYAECDDNDFYTGAWNIPASDGKDLTIDSATNNPFIIGNFGYDSSTYSGRTVASYLNPIIVPERSMINAFKYFQNNNLNGYTSKLAIGNWCYNDIAYDDTIGTNRIDKDNFYNIGTKMYYDSYVRLIGKTEKEPTLKCNGTVINKYNDNSDMLVGTLSLDEVTYAGAIYNNANSSNFLINNYQKHNSLWFFILSLNRYSGSIDMGFRVGHTGMVFNTSLSNNSSFRPVVLLKANTGIVKGDGTQDNPYVVE